jgi:hypothetical protein
MSDHFIRFIPLDPRLVPGEKAQAAALALLRAVAPDADEISSETEDHIAFRDCGENFERVRCPGCGTEIEIATWQGWMARDYTERGGFRLEPVATSCCGKRETLNDLVYDMPQGFSRYVLTGMNLGRDLPSRVMAELGKTLGCRLRMIHQMI